MRAGGESEIVLRLRSVELFALTSLAVDRVRDPEGTQIWEDIVTGKTVTLDELLSLLLDADEPA